MLRNDIELMAPAGDFESLQAAIQGGANAVYFGVGKLNMRSGSAKNFRVSDLVEINSICREAGISSYLTLNIVVYDHELGEIEQLIIAAKSAGINAVIAADHAVMNLARKHNMPLHLSTQANISNIESVKFFAQFADVLVLARELSLEQVQHICESIRQQSITGPSGDLVQIEIFVHGALCMAVSGKCYLSLHQTNTSANRGACRQICRRGYEVTDLDTGNQLQIDHEYIMSPKDLNTLPFLNKVVEAGVKVLKIEGRGRSPEYVKIVTEAYHKALLAIEEGTFNEDFIHKAEERLASVFNRGFWDGYYLGRKLGEWSDQYGSSATRRKVYIGKGMNYFSNLGVAEFLIESHSLRVGDEIIITGPTTGVIETRVTEIRVDLQKVNSTAQGEVCSIPVESKVRRADKLYKVVSASEVITQ
ncbi:MAG: peptidase U32 family protein [Cyclobacteriaceae bacterium]|nr:peptidase U32 family protein [Cyclobacteriaceae bacterium]